MTTKKTPAKKTAASVSAESNDKPAKSSIAKKKAVAIVEQALVIPTHHDIQLLAHEFWVQGGRQHGGDAEDWLRAEEQLKKR